MSRFRLFVIFAIAAIGISAATLFWLQRQSDALWHIVHDRCIPNLHATGNPSPCREAKEGEGFVLLKDRNGPLQYLLIPTEQITGIESPALLQSATPNFFAEAWGGRHLLAEKHGRPIEDRFLSLAINAQHSRSQRQLHIHISCLAPDVREHLDAEASRFTDRWSAVPGGIRGYRYIARRISTQQLANANAFQLLASEVPNAKRHMGRFGLAMTSLADGSLLLLAKACSYCRLMPTSVEEIQDHTCQILAKSSS